MIRTLLSLLPHESRTKVTAHFALTVLSVVIGAAGVVVLVPLVAALFSPSPGDAWTWVCVLIGLTVVGWVVDWVVASLGFELGFGLLATGQHAVADRVERTRLTWFSAENTATTRQAIAATGPDLVGMMIYLVTPLVSALLLPIVIGVALLAVSWQLALAALAGVPVLLGAYWAAGRTGRAADHAAMAANTELTERIVEFARTQHALRAARRVDPERSAVGSALSRQHGATVRVLFMQVPGQLLFSVASQLALVALAGTIVVLTVNGQLSTPEAIALIVVAVRYLEPFTALAELSGGVETSTGVLRKLRTVLVAPAATSGTHEADSDGPAHVELRGAGFRYSSDAPSVFEGLDLVLRPGTTTAIVGPSGSGKSTVLALVAGLHEPTSGQVLVDGVDATEFSAHARADQVSMVFQNPSLFDGTIRDNVLAGNPDASDSELAEATRLARLDLRSFAHGWDTRVGEAGSSLSGGERQRVSIARALLKPAPLLLVDEATSALDTENESAITDALTTDPVPRTRVIVTHRLASIRTADRVLFLEDGAITEDGPVDELLATDGRFAEFRRQQHEATGWRIGHAASV